VEPGGQLDMQQLLQAAAAMQSQLMSAQAELAEAEVEGTAGGGLNGQGELVDLSIAAAAIDGDDREEIAQTLADLVLAAYRDAVHAVDELQQETMAPFAAGFGGGGGLPGMPDLSSFSGFPGLPGVPSQPGPDEPPAEDDPASEN
jgi:nucleoid-associated protein EbfC